MRLENRGQALAPAAGAVGAPYFFRAAAMLVVSAGLAYTNSFSVPFVYDDAPAILANPSIRRLSAAVLDPPAHLTTSGRPLVNLTLALDYAVGGTAVAAYHLTNLAIHLAGGLVLFGLVRRTLTTPRLRLRFGPAAQALAFTTAVLWLLHPLATESVTYVVQRAEALVAGCYLFTLYAFARGVQDGSERWLAAAVIACFAGMATKEVMVSAPLIVLAYDRTLLAGSFAEAWRRRRFWYVLLAASWIVLGAAVASTGGSRDGSAGFGQGVTTWSYAITQIPAIVHYLGLVFWPCPLVFDYGTALVAPSLALVPAGLVLIALAAVTISAFFRRTALGLVGLGFGAVLAPSSSFIPVVTETVAEHRMYLPLALVTAVVVGAAYRAFGRRGLVPLGFAALALGGLTHRRNRDYATAETLWADTVAKRPENARAHNQLGFQLAARGDVTAALAEYRAAIDAQPGDADAHFNAGTALFRLGRTAAALPEFVEALRLRPAYADAHSNYGLALAQLGRAREAIAQYGAALRLDPGNAVTHNDLGIALAQTGQLAGAVAQFEAALQARPDYAEAHNNLGHAYAEAGRPAEGQAQYEAALQLVPDYAEAHNNLAQLLDGRGRPAEAAAHFEAVIRLAPAYAEAHYRLGNDLARLGREAAAIREWQETLRLQPGHDPARHALIRQGQSAGRPD